MPNTQTQLPDKLEMLIRDFHMDEAHRNVIISSFQMMYDQELARKDEEIKKAVKDEQGRVIKEISKYFPDHLGAMLIDVIFLEQKMKSNIKGLESLINKKD